MKSNEKNFLIFAVAVLVMALSGWWLYSHDDTKKEAKTESEKEGIMTEEVASNPPTGGAIGIISEGEHMGAEVDLSDAFLIESLVSGTGEYVKAGDKVKVHYHGTLTDGTIFDSSIDRGTPFEFTAGVGEVIAGWDQVLTQMRVGDKVKVTIPPRLGYGDRAVGKIPANSILIFEIELLDIIK